MRKIRTLYLGKNKNSSRTNKCKAVNNLKYLKYMVWAVLVSGHSSSLFYLPPLARLQFWLEMTIDGRVKLDSTSERLNLNIFN